MPSHKRSSLRALRQRAPPMQGKKRRAACLSLRSLPSRAWSASAALAGASPVQLEASPALDEGGRGFDLVPAGQAKPRLLWDLRAPICRGHWLQGPAGCNLAGQGWALNPAIRVILTGERQNFFYAGSWEPSEATAIGIDGSRPSSFRPVFGQLLASFRPAFGLPRSQAQARSCGCAVAPAGCAGLGGLSSFDTLAI